MDAAEREDDLPDDRITCHTCRNWQVGVCQVKRYRVVVRPMRCEHYLPNAHDPNKQTGLERWPHLIVKGS